MLHRGLWSRNPDVAVRLSGANRSSSPIQ